MSSDTIEEDIEENECDEEEDEEEDDDDDSDDSDDDSDDEDEDDEEEEETLFSENSFFLPGLHTQDASLGHNFVWNLSEDSTSSSYGPLMLLFDSLFSNQMDRLILEEVSSESMSTYHHELLRRDDRLVISDKCTRHPFSSEAHRNSRCFICMEDYEKEEEILLLTCRHVFHPSCIGNAVMYNSQCPLCRSPIECDVRKPE